MKPLRDVSDISGRLPCSVSSRCCWRVCSSGLSPSAGCESSMPAGGSTTLPERPGPSAAIRLHDPALHWKLVTRPRLYFREAFMDGSLTIEEGSLYDLVDLLASISMHCPMAFCRAAAERLSTRFCAAFINTTRCRAPGRTWLTITICRTSFTSCSSTATGNIPAPIFAETARISTPRNSTKSGTSRQICCSSRGTRCSISARAGAAWRSISQPNAVPR